MQSKINPGLSALITSKYKLVRAHLSKSRKRVYAHMAQCKYSYREKQMSSELFGTFYRLSCIRGAEEYLSLCVFFCLMAKTDNIIINCSGIWFGKKCAKISNIILTRKQVISDPEAFLESGSETRMSSILLLWTLSVKYCSKLKGEYTNSKSGSGKMRKITFKSEYFLF